MISFTYPDPSLEEIKSTLPFNYNEGGMITKTKYKWSRSKYNSNKAMSSNAWRFHSVYDWSIGFSIVHKKYTSMLVFDFDDHYEVTGKIVTEEDRINAIALLNKLLGEGTLLELAEESKGFHLYYLLDKPMLWDDVLKLKKIIENTYGIEYDLPKFIRFPKSNKYYIERFEPKTFIDTKIVYDILGPIKEEKEIIITSPYIRETEKVLSKQSLFECKIGEGTRNDGMLHMTRLNAYLKLPIEELITIAKDIDTGSKDFKVWNNEKIAYYFKSMANKCKIPIKEEDKAFHRDTDTFISNKDKIPKWLDHLCGLQEMKLGIADKFKAVKQNKRFQVGNYGSILLKEIFGKWIYNESIEERKIKHKRYISDNKKQDLLVGFQMSRKELEMIKNTYNMDVDINKLYRSVMALPVFKQFKHNGLGWSYGEVSFCKQYFMPLSYKRDRINPYKKLSILTHIMVSLSNYLRLRQHKILLKISGDWTLPLKSLVLLKQLKNILKVFCSEVRDKTSDEYYYLKDMYDPLSRVS